MDNRFTLVIGRPGMGKSTYLDNSVFDAIAENDCAIFVIDPHGESVARIADALPRSAIKRTAIIDPSEAGYAVGFNPLRAPVQLQLAGYQSIWPDNWGPQTNYLLKYALLVLYENPASTISDLVPLFNDRLHRARMLEKVRSHNTLHFWRTTFPREYEKSRKEPYLPIINKIDTITTDANVRRILCQRHPKLDLKDAILNKRIVLVNLATAVTGDEGTAIIGALFTTALRAAVLEVNGPLVKAQKPPHKLALFADEFPLYGTSIYAKILAQLRKYGMNQVVIATQFLAQIPPELRAAILGTVSKTVAFNVTLDNAEIIAGSFNRATPGSSAFDPTNITQLAPFEAYENGVKARMPPFTAPYGTGKLQDVQEYSRRRFARPL